MSTATVDLTIGGAGILRPVAATTVNPTSYNVAAGRTLIIDATFQATSGTTTVNFPGAGGVNINKLPATTSLRLINNGSGVLTIGGTSTSSTTEVSASSTTVSGGKVTINGPTITTTQLGTYGSTTRTGIFELQSGEMNFNAGVRTSITDGSLIKVTDGTFTATTVDLARTSNPGLGGNAPATSGFVAVGGTASIASLLIGSSNSSATALIDGGAVTVTTAVNMGSGSIGLVRWNTLQVNSGSLTVSGADGIQMSTNSASGSISQVRLTGGTTTTEAIKFGVAASLAGSRGDLEVGPMASLYVGSGGINMVSLNSYITNFIANGGTIGAKAPWASTVPLVLGDTSTFKAADVANVSFGINLSGGISGVGGLIKTGNGTLTVSGVAPSYNGDTTVSAGTLSFAQPNNSNESSTLSIVSGAFLNLNFIGTDTVDKFFINGVQQPAGTYEAVDNPGSNFKTSRITGTGTLTVSSGPPGSGFSTWITGTFVNGSVPGDKQGPNDDPDNDGIDNLTEYAVADLDPTVGNGSLGSLTGLNLSFAKRQPLAGDVTYAIEQSSDLGIADVWDEVAPSVNDGTTISYTFPGVLDKDFLRLKVIRN